MGTSLLALSGDRHISVVARNKPGMKLEIGRVLPEQLQHLVSLNDGTYSKPQVKKPCKKSIGGPAGRPLLNGTKTTL